MERPDRFEDRLTLAVYQGESPKGFPASLAKTARRKLGYLDAAVDLNDLRSPPGNRLEALSGGGNDRDRCWAWRTTSFRCALSS